MTSPTRPWFSASLYPTWVPTNGRPLGRFLLRTAWQFRRTGPPGGVLGWPVALESLLGAEESFFSVLPYGLQQRGVWWAPLPGSDTWRGIPCGLGLARVWVMNTVAQEMVGLSVTVLLPERPAQPDPLYPILGNEFFRRYEPAVRLGYARFPWAGGGYTQACGTLEL